MTRTIPFKNSILDIVIDIVENIVSQKLPFIFLLWIFIT